MSKTKEVDVQPESHEFKFPLGTKVREVITGFEGVVTHRVQFMTGCDQYGIDAGLDKDGVPRKLEQFDENRLVAIGEPITLPGNEKKEEPKAKAPKGGPQPMAACRRR